MLLCRSFVRRVFIRKMSDAPKREINAGSLTDADRFAPVRKWKWPLCAKDRTKAGESTIRHNNVWQCHSLFSVYCKKLVHNSRLFATRWRYLKSSFFLNFVSFCYFESVCIVMAQYTPLIKIKFQYTTSFNLRGGAKPSAIVNWHCCDVDVIFVWFARVKPSL